MYVKLSRLQKGQSVAYRWLADIHAKGGQMMVEGDVTPLMQDSLDELRRLFPDDAKFLQAIVTDHQRSTYVKAELVQD